jgi:processive 1,2-diacylglycerol beta-glucosyltransferase
MILKHEIETKLITVVTDYDKHRIWLNGSKVEEAAIVGCSATKDFFVKNKLNRNIIHEFGIPIYPVTDDNFDADEIKNKFPHPDYPICLFFSGGGAGNTRSYNYLKKALSNKLDINFIYIAGKNTRALNKVNKLIEENKYENIITYGFVTNVGDFLNTCDFVVSKPGGIQTTEALAYGKPMITILSAGGQENYNLHYLEKEKFGCYFHTSRNFNKYLKKISENPYIIKEYQENIQNNIMNDAMEKLFDLVEKTI